MGIVSTTVPCAERPCVSDLSVSARESGSTLREKCVYAIIREKCDTRDDRAGWVSGTHVTIKDKSRGQGPVRHEDARRRASLHAHCNSPRCHAGSHRLACRACLSKLVRFTVRGSVRLNARPRLHRRALGPERQLALVRGAGARVLGCLKAQSAFRSRQRDAGADPSRGHARAPDACNSWLLQKHRTV